MQEAVEFLLALVTHLPVEMLYLFLGVGAAIETVFPPVPSDTFVVAGAILADHGVLVAGGVFGVALVSNVGSALLMYAGSRKYGRAVFDTRWGRRLLRPAQLERLAGFYEKYGSATIFVSRFVPVFRVLVPAFAGISRLGFWTTALPLSAASAVWYGFLVLAGVFVSQNIPRLTSLLKAVNSTGLVVALLVGLALFMWRKRTRDRHEHEAEAERSERQEEA